MHKNKNGFTLVELLAVIVILGILAVVAGGSIIGSLGGAKGDIDEVQKKLIIGTAKLYFEDNFSGTKDDLSEYNGKYYYPVHIQDDLVNKDNMDQIKNDKGQIMYGTVCIEVLFNEDNTIKKIIIPDNFKYEYFSTNLSSEEDVEIGYLKYEYEDGIEKCK